MAKFAVRLTLLEAGLVLAAALVVGKAAQLQLVEGAKWRGEAQRARQETVVLPARRGGLYDRSGAALAVTQEYFAVGIAPNELRERGPDGRVIARALGLPPAQVARDIASRRWVYYQGPFSGLQVQPIRDLRGVHLEGSFARHYPAGSLARGVIGALRPDSGTGATGLELALDSILTGKPGRAVVLKDFRGRRYASPSRLVEEPVPGQDVILSLDAELQEIAERAIEEAMERYHATGGDIVMLDPRTGELLALASRVTVDGRRVTTKASFFTDPFQPGSTAKLFTAGALLARGKVGPTDEVYGEDGVWVMEVSSRGVTRTIHDAHKVPGNLTLAQAIKVSSNIAMGKFSQRLSAGEQYDAMRDFGFGSPTGVTFPSEARGTLRLPDRWDGYSKASIAMGYEFQVTPVQLAVAYGAIANDGILLTPALVREIRTAEQTVRWRHKPEPVRRAVSPKVARTLREYLRGVVEAGGTAEAVQLSNYSLAGKTGTAVRFDGQAYVPGSYTATFAAIFPADDPLLVVVVKIDDPKGAASYGAQTAAPLTRAMLEEALASRRSAIDRRRLGGSGEESRPAEATPVSAADPEPASVVLSLPLTGDTTGATGRRVVPNVAGQSLRHAASAVHRRGFRVGIRGAGSVLRTTPAAGDSLRYGATVTLWAE